MPESSRVENLTELAVTPLGTDIVYIVDDPAGSPVGKKITVDNLTGLVDPRGLQDVWIPASAMWASTTAGATGLTKVETATNKVNYQSFGFTQSTTDEFAEFNWCPPRNWNGGTITAQFYWTAIGGGAGNTIWGIAGRSFASDDALDQAYPASTDTTASAWIANSDVHISPETGAHTITGATAGDVCQFRINRGVSASDTFTTQADLIGVRITYTISTTTSA